MKKLSSKLVCADFMELFRHESSKYGIGSHGALKKIAVLVLGKKSKKKNKTWMANWSRFEKCRRNNVRHKNPRARIQFQSIMNLLHATYVYTVAKWLRC